MEMFDYLQILYQVANIAAVALTVVSYVMSVVAKRKKSILATANIQFPIYSEQKPIIKHCFVSGFIFMLLSWILCTSEAAENGGRPLEDMSELLLSYAFIWAIMIFVSVVAEVVIKCIRTAGDIDCSVAPGIKSSIWYTVICFVFSFLIA